MQHPLRLVLPLISLPTQLRLHRSSHPLLHHHSSLTRVLDHQLV
jgi:hypothetical protein